MRNVEQIPHFLKYMGAKRDILAEIDEAVRSLNVDSTCFCDLFAGTSVVSYAMSDMYDVISNDIQAYSSVFARTYFADFSRYTDHPVLVGDILKQAESHKEELDKLLATLGNVLRHTEYMSFEDFEKCEYWQQGLINSSLEGNYILFTKFYSGTYWSLEQCQWIDSIRKVADACDDPDLKDAIMSSLIFAMSYSSQSTGHFAQFRKITERNYMDILSYRRRPIPDMFARKLTEILSVIVNSGSHNKMATTMDYVDCLNNIPRNAIVYADPPYSNVHYSRFYHAVETLVKYDYPKIKYTGRYRSDRHQSPFDQKTAVKVAFRNLFAGVINAGAHLVLSYSDNGMLTPDEIMDLAGEMFGDTYDSDIFEKDYSHMKMGRSDEYKMDVKELLLTFKRRSI
jgi:adenine-specific DNA-methyltransferase